MKVLVSSVIIATVTIVCFFEPFSVRSEYSHSTCKETYKETYKVLLTKLLEKNANSKSELSSSQFQNLVDALYSSSVASPKTISPAILDLEAIKDHYSSTSTNYAEECNSKYGVSLAEFTLLNHLAMQLREHYWNYQAILDEYALHRAETIRFLSQLEPKRLNSNTLAQLSDHNRLMSQLARRLIDTRDSLPKSSFPPEVVEAIENSRIPQ